MFSWKDEYSVGVASIDQQHKKLFDMGQAMSDLVTHHGDEDIYDELITMFNDLADYTKVHFTHEENLMASVNYEGLDNHIIEHQRFIDKINDLDLTTIDEDQGKFAMSLLKTIATWIFKHITGDDFKYKDALKGQA